MAIVLKVFTLNCWGVATPLACQFRHERINAIADELAKAEYDIILLQEIWTQADYKILSAKLSTSYPHRHYFHSGMFGSGVCVFSKTAIVETFYLKYSINGYAHKIFHGDWFCGKLVGLAKIQFKGININVYVTHAHAEYNKDHDEYFAQRLVQAYELSQFIKHTGETCDINIVGGDFNMRAGELGYKIIRANGNLEDAWINQKERPAEDGATSETPTNSFTTEDRLKLNPHGERLDYIMYRGNGGYTMTCDKCSQPLGKVPERDFSYSDHEALEATFSIRKNITAMTPPLNTADCVENFQEAIPMLEKGIKKARFDQTFYLVAGIVLFLAYMFMDCIPLPYGLGYIMACVEVLLALAMAFSLWMALVLSPAEENGCTAAMLDMKTLLQSYKSK